jgi:nucleoside-diphosphate-sugar epimerase
MPLETLRVNSDGTWKLLEIARKHRARFLFASTSEIYGDPHVHPQAEDYWGNVSPIGPRSCYDESKRFGEALTMQYWRSFGVDCRVVRIFNTYGPHSRLDDGRVVPNFIGQALAGEPITIYGVGTQTRSFCYVSDLVDGLIAAMLCDNLAGQVFNLGNPEEHTITELAEIVVQVVSGLPNSAPTGCHHQVTWHDLPKDDPTRRRPDIEKAATVLNWSPKVSLRDGLRQTIAWFRQDAHNRSATAVAPADAREE